MALSWPLGQVSNVTGERKAPDVAEGTKTIVGVPSLERKAAPAPTPSETLVGSRSPAIEGSDSNTAVDVKALSAAEADRVLKTTGFTQEEIPTAQPRTPVKGNASPKPPPASGGSPLSPGPRRTSKPPPLPGPGTRPGLAPKGRSTLLLDGEAPKAPGAGSENDGDLEATNERPPIVVPAPNQNAPKAITQSPPWGDGTVQLGKQIPKDALPPKVDPDVEELSDSLLVPDAAPSAQEISSSHVLPDDSGSLKKVARPAPAKPAAKMSKPPLPPARPSARPPSLPGKAASIPPPLPTSPTPTVHTAAGSVPTSLAWPAPAPPPLQAPSPPVEAAPPPPLAPPLGEVPMPVASRELPPGALPISTLPPTADDLPLSARGRAMQKAKHGLETALAKAKPALHVAKARSKEGLTVAHHNFRELEGMLAALLPPGHKLRQTRPTWLFPAIAGGSVVVSLILWGTMCSVLSPAARPADLADTSPSGSASGTQARSATPTAATAGSRSRAGTVAPCTLGGGQHIVAPNALVASGVEVMATGGGVALGMATSEKEGLVVSLDPTSLSATATSKVRGTDTIRRVTPLMGGRGLTGVADVDKKGDRIEGRRVVAADPPFDIGGLGGQFVAGPHGSNAAVNLWPLEGDGTVEAARGVRAGEGAEQRFALAFRRGSSIWVGAASGERASDPKGALSRIEGLGDRVGSPALAVAGDTVFAAWADRASESAPWGLRYVIYKLGEAPGTPAAFTVPAGGKGEQAMSPGVAALPSGGFLLVWTEGPMSEHDVRAQTLGADGSPVGSPLLISTEGTNAGQGQVAVMPDGRGVVAFLVANGRTGEVVAVPVTCPSGDAP
jgi:hypothetical protein